MQGQTGSLTLPSSPRSLLSALMFPPVLSTTSTPFLLRSLPPHLLCLPLPFPPPVPSSQVEHFETGPGFVPCTVQRVPCQALRVQGCSPGTGNTGLGPGLCSSRSGQLAEQLKAKHSGRRDQRQCSDSTCTIFADYYVTEFKGNGERRVKWKEVIGCEILYPAAAAAAVRYRVRDGWNRIARSLQGKKKSGRRVRAHYFSEV